ncbi:MAG TPA: hypothetical protein VGB93_08005, partial [Methylovirgula sp.]
RDGSDEQEAMKHATALLAEMSGTIALARITGSPAKAQDILQQKRIELKTRLGLTDESGAAG